MSGVRQANHKNHALNMTELVKTAVLHEDDALRHSTGTAMPELPESFQFPVVVDLTEFEDKLEQRFASINGNIERLRSELESKPQFRCEGGWDWTSKETVKITYTRAFTTRPTFMVGLARVDTDAAQSFVNIRTTGEGRTGVTVHATETKCHGDYFWMACGY